jgi:hypothetical protein
MNMLRPKSASALLLLLLVACATTKVEPPELPEMPGAPTVELTNPPMLPPVAPRPPAPPSYTLPKATDISWKTVWQEDFVNDSAPQPLPKGLLSPTALVIPPQASESARLGMISSLLSIGLGAADMGKDVAAELSMGDQVDAVTYSLRLLDPVGRWVHSQAFQAPAVKTAFVVRDYAYEELAKSVVKFNIQANLQELEDYNEKVVAYQSKREAYRTERARYDQEFADYLETMQKWREDMTAAIEEARRQHEANSRKVEAEYRARWDEYRKKAEAARKPVEPAPELQHAAFDAPNLPELRAPAPAAVPEALTPLSLEDMRALLLTIATEAVPATSITLRGQFVEVGSGLTLATIDGTLVLPTEGGKTEATMLRELVLRIAR